MFLVKLVMTEYLKVLVVKMIVQVLKMDISVVVDLRHQPWYAVVNVETDLLLELNNVMTETYLTLTDALLLV